MKCLETEKWACCLSGPPLLGGMFNRSILDFSRAVGYVGILVINVTGYCGLKCEVLFSLNKMLFLVSL